MGRAWPFQGEAQRLREAYGFEYVTFVGCPGKDLTKPLVGGMQRTDLGAEAVAARDRDIRSIAAADVLIDDHMPPGHPAVATVTPPG